MNPLAILQARIGSKRLPGKMLLDLGGKPLVYWAWKAAVDAFGAENVVVAIPHTAENHELADTVERFGGNVFRWDGPEDDVLGRFHACAHRYRWHPDSVVVRVTPDDPFKVPALMKRVAEGERHPVELGGEAFTLAMLDEARLTRSIAAPCEAWMEHIGNLTELVPTPPPAPPPGVWTVDTMADLEAARRKVSASEYIDGQRR